MKIFRQYGYVWGWTDARWGDGKQEDRLTHFAQTIGFNTEKKLVRCRQVHGNVVAKVDSWEPSIYPETDGLISESSTVVLGVYTADCVPIFIFVPGLKRYSIVHAGWRGVQKQIVLESLRLFQNYWNVSSEKLKVYIGPHIQSCCYEVGEEVSAQFPLAAVHHQNKFLLNLTEAISQQLIQHKVLLENIENSLDCTFCNTQYFSFRRDQTKKRMLSFISIQ